MSRQYIFVWDKYGKTFSDKNYKDAFKNNRDSNGEFAASYEELTNAKENMKRVIADGYTRDSKEYMEAEKAEAAGATGYSITSANSNNKLSGTAVIYK